MNKLNVSETVYESVLFAQVDKHYGYAAVNNEDGTLYGGHADLESLWEYLLEDGDFCLEFKNEQEHIAHYYLNWTFFIIGERSILPAYN